MKSEELDEIYFKKLTKQELDNYLSNPIENSIVIFGAEYLSPELKKELGLKNVD